MKYNSLRIIIDSSNTLIVVLYSDRNYYIIADKSYYYTLGFLHFVNIVYWLAYCLLLHWRHCAQF
jgi:hypothetical protein